MYEAIISDYQYNKIKLDINSQFFGQTKEIFWIRNQCFPSPFANLSTQKEFKVIQ